jgi:hypothetical protein
MEPARDLRLPALRRFAAAITLLNVLGHTWFGFEQSWATPLVAVAVAYATEILLERVDAWQRGRAPRFPAPGGLSKLGADVDFLLSAHITGLAVSMLLYAGDRLWPIAFASAAAIGSKHVFRVAAGGPGGRSRHVFNPSNLGITATLLAFPSVGIAQPYMFTENLSPAGAWILPALLVMAGTFLNGRFTKKLPLVGGWLGGFFLQALVRDWLFGNRLAASLLPMTGVAFLLFTYYMVTDPATTPVPARRQVAFGAAVAAAYGILVALHIVFGLFFALTAVCSLRGAALYAAALAARQRASAPAEGAAAPVPVSALGDPGL